MRTFAATFTRLEGGYLLTDWPQACTLPCTLHRFGLNSFFTLLEVPAGSLAGTLYAIGSNGTCGSEHLDS
jgi:hypothetical protein